MGQTVDRKFNAVGLPAPNGTNNNRADTGFLVGVSIRAGGSLCRVRYAAPRCPLQRAYICRPR